MRNYAGRILIRVPPELQQPKPPLPVADQRKPQPLTPATADRPAE